jgi:hypothetical protein
VKDAAVQPSNFWEAVLAQIKRHGNWNLTVPQITSRFKELAKAAEEEEGTQYECAYAVLEEIERQETETQQCGTTCLQTAKRLKFLDPTLPRCAWCTHKKPSRVSCPKACLGRLHWGSSSTQPLSAPYRDMRSLSNAIALMHIDPALSEDDDELAEWFRKLAKTNGTLCSTIFAHCFSNETVIHLGEAPRAYYLLSKIRAVVREREFERENQEEQEQEQEQEAEDELETPIKKRPRRRSAGARKRTTPSPRSKRRK